MILGIILYLLFGCFLYCAYYFIAARKALLKNSLESKLPSFDLGELFFWSWAWFIMLIFAAIIGPIILCFEWIEPKIKNLFIKLVKKTIK